MGQEAGGRRRKNLLSPPVLLHLPDFCNLGTWLRILLAVNAMAIVAALLVARKFAAVSGAFVETAAYVEPIALATLVTLCAGRRVLASQSSSVAVLATLGAALFWTTAMVFFLAPLSDGQLSLPFAWLWTTLIVATLLAWFDLSARAHAPAVAEARLMALTARIRPHFLFNSLNAVLGVIRSDPRRAETALEELAELFRSLMQDNRDLVPLSAEIALSRQYLDLERLRLGERLQVRWDIESCPQDALVPPLMLQPLIENAVYHGIEPLGEPGEIEVRLSGADERVRILIANPCSSQEGGNHHVGNRMALDNIRERLSLFFDLEGTLATETRGGRFMVRIELPYRREASK